MDEKSKAKNFVFKLLAKRYKTEFEVKNALKKKFNLSEEEIDEIISEAKSIGLISDEYFAKTFVESKINKGYGSRYIKATLKSKGIELDEPLSPNIEKVIEIIKRKYGKELETTNQLERKKTINKIFNFLSYRGFSSDEIKEIIRKINYDA